MISLHVLPPFLQETVYTLGEASLAIFVAKTWAVTIHGGSGIGASLADEKGFFLWEEVKDWVL